MGIKILIFFAGFIISVILSIIVFKKYLKNRDKEYCEALLLAIQEHNDIAKRLKNTSGIEYTINEKGEDYAIYFYGTLYKILHQLRGKTYHMSNVEKSMHAFLNVALARDIEEYKKNQEKYKEKQEELLKKIEETQKEIERPIKESDEEGEEQ